MQLTVELSCLGSVQFQEHPSREVGLTAGHVVTFKRDESCRHCSVGVSPDTHSEVIGTHTALGEPECKGAGKQSTIRLVAGEERLFRVDPAEISQCDKKCVRHGSVLDDAPLTGPPVTGGCDETNVDKAGGLIAHAGDAHSEFAGSCRDASVTAEERLEVAEAALVGQSGDGLRATDSVQNDAFRFEHHDSYRRSHGVASC